MTARSHWEGIASRARARRGVAVNAGVVAKATASHVRAGRIAALRPASEWSAHYVRTDEPGRVLLYVAYLGPQPN